MSHISVKIACNDLCLEGIYKDAGYSSPLAIIVNGHNGFYNYGVFPYIQQKLLEKGISSYSFNFSHGGVKGGSDFFEELDKYEKNCMRLETGNTLCVLKNTHVYFQHHTHIFLLSHSLGGIPAIFAGYEASETGIKINGRIMARALKMQARSGLQYWLRVQLVEPAR